jgi:hypothetical protein
LADSVLRTSSLHLGSPDLDDSPVTLDLKMETLDY